MLKNVSSPAVVMERAAPVSSRILYPVTDGEIRARLAELESTIRSIAARVLGVPESEIIVTDIEPDDDLGFASKAWSESLGTANAWNTVVDNRDPGDKVIGIVGVRSLTTNPLTTAIEFVLGSATNPVSVLGRFDIEPMSSALDASNCLFSKNIIVGRGQRFSIRHYARAAGTDRIVYLGLVALHKGVRGPTA
jgi:hypothetical protein